MKNTSTLHASDAFLRVIFQNPDVSEWCSQDVMNHVNTCLQCKKRFQRISSEFIPSEDDTVTELESLDLIPGGRFGEYDIIEVLGKGGFGTVYRVCNPRLNHDRALKILANGGDRLLEEARRMVQVDSPNVVKVHSAGDIGGETYIEMELIVGKNLDELLEAGRPTLQQAVTLMQQIANGLCAIHDKGLLHGDLSGPNVMVGSSRKPFVGIPKLLDFGWTQAEGFLDPTPFDAAGTKDYLAPELRDWCKKQERCKEPDDLPPFSASSDVYAAGELFRRLLVGKLTGNGCEKLDDFDKDLRAIVDKCLADRHSRYASAHELREDLSFYQTGRSLLYARETPRVERALKWVKRNRASSFAAVSAAVVVAVFTASLYVQNRKLILANELADANLVMATDTIENNAIRLEETLHDVPGMQSVRERMLGESIRFYDSLIARYKGRPEFRERLALVLNRLGVLLHGCTAGDPKAWDCLYAAKEIREERVSEAPADLDRQSQLADTLTTLGDVADKSNTRREQALDVLRRALRIRRLVHDTLPTDQSTAALAETLTILAEALKVRDRRSDEALALQTEATYLADSSGMESRMIALMHNRLANQLHNHRRLTEAFDHVTRAIDIRRGLKEKNPGSLSLQYELAFSLNNRGLMESEIGKLAESERDYSESLAFRRHLAQDNPKVIDFQQQLAGSLNNLGLLHFRQINREGDSRIALEEARTIRIHLVKQFPENIAFAMGLGHVEQNLGNLLEGRDDAKAMELYESAIRYREMAVRAAPDRADYRMHWVHSLTLAGKLRAANECWEPAERDLRKAIEIAEGVMPQNKNDRYAFELARARALLAESLAMRGDARAAAELFRSVLSDLDGITERVKDADEYQGWRVRVRARLATINGDEIALAKAVDEGKKLVAENQTNREHQSELAIALEKYGEYLMTNRRASEAIPYLREAVVRRNGDRRELAYGHARIAHALEAIGNKKEALSEYEIAETLLAFGKRHSDLLAMQQWNHEVSVLEADTLSIKPPPLFTETKAQPQKLPALKEASAPLTSTIKEPK